jgi:hypothetical protein
MNHELSEALAKLGENIENNKRKTKRFDYGDYRVLVADYKGSRNIELEKDGQRSVTDIKEDGSIGHTELFDINDKAVDEPVKKAERVSIVEKITGDLLGASDTNNYFEEF